MNLPQSIDLNKTALVRIVAGLFALLGWTEGADLGRIPKRLHRAVINVLRPAESAVRRLIVALAQSIKAEPPKPRPPSKKPARKELRRGPRRSFAFFDPLSRFFRKRRPKGEPRARPSITFFGNGEPRRVFFGAPPPPPSDGLETSVNIVARLEAIKAALEDLPGQAQRLAFVLARRETTPRLKIRAPLRGGPAPGARRKPVEEIHRVLEQCHGLARAALAPNTS